MRTKAGQRTCRTTENLPEPYVRKRLGFLTSPPSTLTLPHVRDEGDGIRGLSQDEVFHGTHLGEAMGPDHGAAGPGPGATSGPLAPGEREPLALEDTAWPAFVTYSQKHPQL